MPTVPFGQRAGGDAKLGIDNDSFFIEARCGAEPVAGWTGTARVIERKNSWFQLIEHVAAVGTAKLGAVDFALRFHHAILIDFAAHDQPA